MTDPPNLLSPQPPRSQWRVSIERAQNRSTVYDRIEHDAADAIVGALRDFYREHPEAATGVKVCIMAAAVHE